MGEIVIKIPCDENKFFDLTKENINSELKK